MPVLERAWVNVIIGSCRRCGSYVAAAAMAITRSVEPLIRLRFRPARWRWRPRRKKRKETKKRPSAILFIYSALSSSFTIKDRSVLLPLLLLHIMKLLVSLSLSLSTALFPPAKLGNNVRLSMSISSSSYSFLNMYPQWGREKGIGH